MQATTFAYTDRSGVISGDKGYLIIENINLHDERVRARLIQKLRVLERVVQLAVADKDIESDVALYVSCAAVGDGVRHFLVRKALRVAARIESR